MDEPRAIRVLWIDDESIPERILKEGARNSIHLHTESTLPAGLEWIRANGEPDLVLCDVSGVDGLADEEGAFSVTCPVYLLSDLGSGIERRSHFAGAISSHALSLPADQFVVLVKALIQEGRQPRVPPSRSYLGLLMHDMAQHLARASDAAYVLGRLDPVSAEAIDSIARLRSALDQLRVIHDRVRLQ